MRGTRAATAALVAAAAGAFAHAAHAAVNADIVAGPALAVTTSAGSSVVLSCEGGFVKVNHGDPNGGPTACAALTSIGLDGDAGQNVRTVTEVAQYGANVQIDGLGGDGSDAYHAVFGSLGTGASIADSGPSGADSLDYTNCSASVSSPGVLSRSAVRASSTSGSTPARSTRGS